MGMILNGLRTFKLGFRLEKKLQKSESIEHS
jgi:hypothetical protein